MHSNGQTVANRQINLPTDIQGQTDSQPASQTNRQTNKETSRMKERKKERMKELPLPQTILQSVASQYQLPG